MAEILFYHLTETKLEDSLPQLLEKTLQKGWRASVHFGSKECIDAFDEHLWTYRDDSFMGHGTDSADHATEQPILLTMGPEAANKAQVKFVVDNGPEPDFESAERVVFMFDGHDQAQLQQARERWKALSQSGVDKTYWKQTPDRRWERKG